MRAREQRCVPRSTGMGIKTDLAICLSRLLRPGFSKNRFLKGQASRKSGFSKVRLLKSLTAQAGFSCLLFIKFNDLAQTPTLRSPTPTRRPDLLNLAVSAPFSAGPLPTSLPTSLPTYDTKIISPELRDQNLEKI